MKYAETLEALEGLEASEIKEIAKELYLSAIELRKMAKTPQEVSAAQDLIKKAENAIGMICGEQICKEITKVRYLRATALVDNPEILLKAGEVTFLDVHFESEYSGLLQSEKDGLITLELLNP